MLNKVKDSWIKGVLENSLHSKVLFELDIKERRNAVQRPFRDLEELSIESDKSFEWLQASDIFEEMGAGRTLLILGEPGTGKTISLLKLAERLIKQAEQNSILPIPVVLNLSSWSSKRQPIAEWLVTELKAKYQVSKTLSKTWIEEEQLILLLDGLDEVTAAHRNECVRALNQFIETHGITEIVICSRIQDYEALSERLKLRSAICIQPLSSEYIDWYFDDVGKPLEGLKTLLKRDEELEEFAKTPLILSIMTLTYKNYTSQQILQQLWQKENRHQTLFNDYIEQMFKRRGKSKSYRKELVISWLIWIANCTKESSFLIEHLQPEQLDKKSKSISLLSILVSWRSLYTVLCIFIFSLAISLFSSLVLSFIFYQSFIFLPIIKIINDWIEFSNHQWILCGNNPICRRYIAPILLIIDPRFASIYIPILFFSFVYNKKIKITEKFDLSLENLKTSFFQSLSNIQNIYKIFFEKIKLEVIRISSLVSRQSRQEFDAQQTASENNIRDELVVRTKKLGGNLKIILTYDNYLKSKNKRPLLDDKHLLFSITSIIIMLLLLPFIYLTLPVLTLIHFLLNAPSEIIDKTTPNRGIWNSLRYSTLCFILCNTIAYVLLSIFNSNVSFAYYYGYFVCLLVGLSWGGFAVIQHLSLRIVLYVSRKSPWNYTHFLDYTKELLFIQNAGGYYIFTHRMLMEHFAQMKKDKSQYF